MCVCVYVCIKINITFSCVNIKYMHAHLFLDYSEQTSTCATALTLNSKN